MLDFIKTIINALKTYVDSKIFTSKADWNQNDERADNYIKNKPDVALNSDIKILQKDVSNQQEEINGIHINLDEIRATANTVSLKMDKNNPVGTGSFSMNRMPDTIVGDYSHAEGNGTTASGYASHAEGRNTIASESYSHAEGNETIASGAFSHAEGNGTTASGQSSHAEGQNTIASGYSSHAEGSRTIASGNYSHAEGYYTTASGYSSHAEGYETITSGKYSHAEGSGSHLNTITITGDSNSTIYSVSSGDISALINNILKYGNVYARIISYDSSSNTIVTDKTLNPITSLNNVNIPVISGVAYGDNSHAEGSGTIALGDSSHAEGSRTRASGYASHAEGNRTIALGDSSHAEGYDTTASGNYSHAEGVSTTANGESSHAEGHKTIASGEDQHVQGKWNINDVDVDGNPLNTYAHIVGNGNPTTSSNAHTLDWEGNAWFSGDVYTGSTSGTNRDEGSKKLATEEQVTSQIAEVEATLSNAIAENNLLISDLNTEVDTKANQTDLDALENLVGTTSVQSQISSAIADLVDSAPETLDTLSELATAIQENDSVIDTLNAAITDKADKTSLEETNANVSALQGQVTATSLILADSVTGERYTIQIQNGQLVSFPVEE